jgi:hypothetical protein
MPIYKAKIAGRNKPVLVRADTAAKARDQVVEVEALDSGQLQDALEAGEAVWKPGTPLPEDDKPEAEAEQGGGEKGSGTGGTSGAPAE